MATHGEKWIELLGWYAAHEAGSEKALFHERMERGIANLGIPPIEFVHPMQKEIMDLIDVKNGVWTNVLLTGEAGVGKTCAIHKLHTAMGGEPRKLKARGNYWINDGATEAGAKYQAHINRDLSAWRKFGGTSADAAGTESAAIGIWSELILGRQPIEGAASFFAIAANDGQLLKAWRDYSHIPHIAEAFKILTRCLQKGVEPPEGVPLKIFHLSSLRSDSVFALCLDAVVEHPGWKALEAEHSADNDIFASTSPLRRNYLALRDPTIRKRLLDLARLCDSNDWHLPIRNILAMLANAILGVSDKKSTGVMNVNSVRQIISEGRPQVSNFFANILGLNLPLDLREKILGPMESFRVGLETINQADNLILFGPDDEDYKIDYGKIFGADPLFPIDPIFEGIRREYLNHGPNDSGEDESPFHGQLVAQRRRLFFRVPVEMENSYNPWGLTNFHHAKEYLEELLPPVADRKAPHSKRLTPLVVALNRVWTGLLLDEKNQIFVTTALDYAAGRSSEIEMRRIPTKVSSNGEFPYVDLDAGLPDSRIPRIAVFLKESEPPITLPLTLTRFEFLKRVAGGALPVSFSRECSEDIRSFKSRILARLKTPASSGLKILHANTDGMAGVTVLNLNAS